MDKKILHDICAYLNFLEQARFQVRLYTNDPVLNACDELRSYVISKCQVPDDGCILPVRADRRMVAQLCVGHEDPERQALLSAVGMPLLYMLERWYGTCDADQHLSPIMQAYHKGLELIRTEYMKDISVELLAKKLGYSASYFGYFFKKQQGVSVGRYVMDVRLEKAMELLGAQHSVASVAEQVGFEDANYLSAAFKAKYGMSPREYRKTKLLHR